VHYLVFPFNSQLNNGQNTLYFLKTMVNFLKSANFELIAAIAIFNSWKILIINQKSIEM